MASKDRIQPSTQTITLCFSSVTFIIRMCTMDCDVLGSNVSCEGMVRAVALCCMKLHITVLLGVGRGCLQARSQYVQWLQNSRSFCCPAKANCFVITLRYIGWVDRPSMHVATVLKYITITNSGTFKCYHLVLILYRSASLANLQLKTTNKHNYNLIVWAVFCSF
jgi:hypothetical protein